MDSSRDRWMRAAAVPGHLALWTGLYSASALLCLVQTTGVPADVFSRRAVAGYLCAWATATSVYLLDRVKLSDRRLDPADAQAKPERYAFLHSRRCAIRAAAAVLALIGLVCGWLVHPLCVALVLGAFVGILIYAGHPPGHVSGRRRRLKDLFIIKNLSVAGSITAFAAGIALLAAYSDRRPNSAGPSLNAAEFLGGALLLLGRVAADAALCDIDDEAADRRYGTQTLPTRLGRERTWLIALGLGAVLVGASWLLPAPAPVRSARILWTGLALVSGVGIRMWNPGRLRDVIDFRFVAIGLIAAAVDPQPPSPTLSGNLDRPSLAQHRDLDLAGKGHLFAHALGDLLGDQVGLIVPDPRRVDHHTDLAPGLDRVRLLDPGHREGDVLQLVEPLDVFFHALAPGAGPGRRNGIGRHHDGRVEAGGRDVRVMAADGVEDRLLLAVLLGELHADLGVAALHLVVHGLPDVVQEPAAARDRAVQPELIRDDLAQVRDLHRVPQHVLAVAGPEVQLAHGLGDLRVHAAEVGLHDGIFAVLDDLLVDLRANLLDDLLDPRRVHASVGNEPLEGLDGHGLADLVEARDDDHAGRVIDDDVHPGDPLDGADVAALAPDDPALHVVGGDGDGPDRGLGGVLGRVALHGHQGDFAGFVLGVELGLLGDLAGQLGHIQSGLILDPLEQEFLGLLGRELGELKQLVPLLDQRGLDFRDPLGDRFLLPLEVLRPSGQVGLLERESLLLAFKEVLSLGQPSLLLLELVSGRLEVADLPDAWDAKMRDYLGLSTLDNPADGPMQDVPWPGGAFGYFPSYTLGAMMAAQQWAAFEKVHPQAGEDLAHGRFDAVNEWRREHIWSQGSRCSTPELIERATGEKLDARFFIEHLERRYG